MEPALPRETRIGDAIIPLARWRDGGPSAALLAEVRAERGGVANFYRMVANSPSTARPLIQLVWALWSESPLGRAAVELIILRVSRLTGSEYEWVSHVPLARAAGVRDEQIDALSAGDDIARSDAFDDRDRTMLAVVDACVAGMALDPALTARFVVEFTPDECIDVMVVAGLYRLVATMLVTFAVPSDAPRSP